MVNQLVVSKRINNDNLSLVYGKFENDQDEDYYILGHDKETSYILQIGSEEGGYSDKIVQRMGESLRTEADGAFDPLYESFSTNLDKVKFPNFNERHVVIRDMNLILNGSDSSSDIRITYLLSEEDTITYHIETTQPNIEETYEEIETFTTGNGTKVTKFASDDDENQYVFNWMDESYSYTMTIALANKIIIESNEFIDIIESALNDTRSSDNKSFFQPLLEDITETSDDKKIIDMLINMKKSP